VRTNPDQRRKFYVLPSLFTLWLKGLGIQHVVIHNVTSNAAVERCQRTVNDYALVGNEDQTPAELQRILDQSIYELNFELPSRAKGCAGQPPVVAHPDLLQPRRPFQPEQELVSLDLQRVDAYLATFTWRWRADENGCIALGTKRRRYSVGRAYARREVIVRFDPTNRHFVFSEASAASSIIRQLPAKGLEVSNLTGLAAWPTGPGAQQLFLPLFSTKRVNR